MKDVTIQDVQTLTPAIKSGVKAYLIARAYAETMRKAVDKIHLEILTECPIYADQFGEARQLLKSGDLYLCGNDDLCQDFYIESDLRLKKIGLKPSNMERYHCPALVAENLQGMAEGVLIEAAKEVFEGMTAHKLICAGLDEYHKYIDLLCGLVVNMPDWENPKV